MRRVTGAVVLVGVAVSAVTGCVTVRGEAKPQRSGEAGPSQRESLPPDDAAAEPRMSRPSVREGLSEPVPAPSRADEDAPPAAVGGPPPGAPGDDVPPAGNGAPRRAPEPRTPVVRSPAVPELPGGHGMCDLGRQYGGWNEGSAPEQVCENAYGS